MLENIKAYLRCLIDKRELKKKLGHAEGLIEDLSADLKASNHLLEDAKRQIFQERQKYQELLNEYRRLSEEYNKCMEYNVTLEVDNKFMRLRVDNLYRKLSDCVQKENIIVE